MKVQISKLLSIASFLVASVFLSNCTHDTSCSGEIKCVDLATGLAVPYATVKIFVTPPAGFYPCGTQDPTSEKTLTADAAGKATFCLRLPATPSVLATSNALTGTGVIATEVGRVVSVTIKMN